jgi:endonuclease G
MRKSLTVFFLFLATSISAAYANDCSVQFYKGQSPALTTQSLTKRLTSICFEEYAILYSGETRTPLWTAEFLTNNRIKEARKLKRQDKFHEEDALPYADRSFLKDYKGSTREGYDRGHISPNSDFSTYSAQFESFSLANIVPQDSDNNQVLWEGIESVTRKLTTQRERLYVVTGPIFDNTSTKLNGRVTIPTRMFKAIVDPARNEAGAYITFNKQGMEYQTISIAELEKISGFNLFPGMAQSMKQNKMHLPEPTPYRDHGKSKNSSHENRHATNSRDYSIEKIGLKLIQLMR